MVNSYRAEVYGIRDDTPTVYTISLKILDDGFMIKPGQFMMIIIKGEKEIKKPYSASFYKNGIIEFCIKKVPGGFFSNYLYGLKKGDKVDISGPFGLFILKEPIKKEVIFLTSGTGISAIKPMLYRFLEIEKNEKAILFLGVREQNEIIYRKEFVDLEKNFKNFKFVPVLSREKWSGENGHVQDVVKKYLDNTNKEVYICGVAKMVEESRKAIIDYGFKEDDVHIERYI